METHVAIETLRRQADALKAEGATALFVYGSRARGTHRPDSDLDVFVDYDPDRKFSLFDLAGIKLLIEDALELAAHVTTRDSLHPKLKAEIERQAIRVFLKMTRDVSTILGEILAAIDTAREASADHTFDSFRLDRITRFAVERANEVISEATRHLPDDLLPRHLLIQCAKDIGSALELSGTWYSSNWIRLKPSLRLSLIDLKIEDHPRLNTRVGCSAPFSISPRATMRPLQMA